MKNCVLISVFAWLFASLAMAQGQPGRLLPSLAGSWDCSGLTIEYGERYDVRLRFQRSQAGLDFSATYAGSWQGVGPYSADVHGQITKGGGVIQFDFEELYTVDGITDPAPLVYSYQFRPSGHFGQTFQGSGTFFDPISGNVDSSGLVITFQSPRRTEVTFNFDDQDVWNCSKR